MLMRRLLSRLALPWLCSTIFLGAMPIWSAELTQNPSFVPESHRTVPLFDFHSNFWINLHQVLLHEALLQGGKPYRGLQSSAPLSDSRLSQSDKAEWSAAVSFYSTHFATRQELFDDQLIQINDALTKQADDGRPDLETADLPPNVAAILRGAAPIYRKYWWDAHNQSNLNWIASQHERVRLLGPKLAAALTRDLHQPWPSEPIRVDVCYYVPQIGHAYTTSPPPHTAYSSSDPSHLGLTGFELLFHEASHTFADTMSDALSAQCRMEHKDCGDMWHAVLFYTSGVELRRMLAAGEQPDFTPYAYKYGVYTRGGWARYRRVLEADWQLYLDRKMSFDSALHAMAINLR